MKTTLVSALSLVAGASILTAGEFAPAPIQSQSQSPSLEPLSEKGVSGILSLDAYSHFASYGADVWGDGDNNSEYAFNPLLELQWDLGGGFTFALGTWWDINDKNGVTDSLGGNIQEIDVWGTIGYSTGIFSTSVTYQEWFFGGDTEKIVDVAFGLDTFLSPSLLVHHRLEQGAATGDEGTIIIAGIEHGFEFGAVSVAIPLNIAYFATDGYHSGTGDTGIGYGSVGVQASVALPFLDSAAGGEWAFNAGATYYITNDDVITENPEEEYFVTNFGISCSF